MNDPSLERRVLEILRERIADDKRELHRDDRLFELMDSLDMVETIMALEEELELAIPDHAADQIKTVGELIDYIHAHAPAPSAPAGDGGRPRA